MKSKKQSGKKTGQRHKLQKETQEIPQTPQIQLNLKTREILLRLRFLLMGLLFIIMGAIVVFTSLFPSGINRLPGNSVLIFGAALAFDITAILILSIYCIIIARKSGLKSAKTLDYERDNQALQRISPDTLKRQSLLFHIPLYLFIVLTAIILIKYYLLSNNGGLIFPMITGIGSIAIFGFQNIYMAITGQFYLLPDFQPEVKKVEAAE